jgi:threonine dehydrogenase-like Zn-dependent dehydrogenase
MRALCWHGKGDVRVDTVPDPTIQHPRDAVIRITACAICGSDLESGDILGHENMGEVVALGSEVTNLRIGDRVVVPFTISCGRCWFCTKGLFSACERTNPNAAMAIKAMGHSPAGLFGFSHMLGGYNGGQAEYLRVPMADIGPIKIPDNVTDEQALFLLPEIDCYDTPRGGTRAASWFTANDCHTTPELHCRVGPVIGQRRNPRKRSGAGPRMDSAHSRDYAP